MLSKSGKGKEEKLDVVLALKTFRCALGVTAHTKYWHSDSSMINGEKVKGLQKPR